MISGCCCCCCVSIKQRRAFDSIFLSVRDKTIWVYILPNLLRWLNFDGNWDDKKQVKPGWTRAKLWDDDIKLLLLASHKIELQYIYNYLIILIYSLSQNAKELNLSATNIQLIIRKSTNCHNTMYFTAMKGMN